MEHGRVEGVVESLCLFEQFSDTVTKAGTRQASHGNEAKSAQMTIDWDKAEAGDTENATSNRFQNWLQMKERYSVVFIKLDRKSVS